MSTVAEVRMWGRRIGAVALDDDAETAAFQYDPAFVESRIQVAPLTMPLSKRVYVFPELPPNTFHGLPGMLADSLPDRFGNAIIDAWLAFQGREPDSFNAIERLCYTGERGMGALEFAPVIGPAAGRMDRIRVDRLVELASDILTERSELSHSFSAQKQEDAPRDTRDTRDIRDILRVGTSAGGARAKAVIAWNPETDEVRSGQIDAGDGFEYWILKFDGVAGNRDRELDDPRGFGAIEYAYSLMATAAGIVMPTCRLFEENGRRHFMSKRFDRTEDGRKLHMQSLGALAHYDFNMAGAYSYEEALHVVRRLDLGMDDIEEMYRRMAFNILARNQDDHVKNIAFLMDKAGSWSLAPAFDMTFSYNPSGAWTARHQMAMNGKQDDFIPEDFRACARTAAMKRGRADEILEEVRSAVACWPEFGGRADVPESWIARIASAHRT